MDIKQTSDYASSALAVFSAISLGALSFIGMYLITASWPWAVIAFFLASVIEGEIFKQVIFQAMNSLFVKGPIAELEKAIAQRELINTNPEYSLLKENKDKAGMKKKEDGFIRHALHSTKQRFSALRTEIRRKTRALYINGVFAVGSGISSGLATLYAANTGLLTLGVASSLALTSAATIATLSAIGYTFMMYKSVADMIQNDTLHKWLAITQTFFARQNITHTQKESPIAYIRRCFFPALGVSTIVALSTFATIATAGTWWIGAKKGALLIPGISERMANVLRTSSVAMMTPTALSFNTDNSLKSAIEVAHYNTENISKSLRKHYLSPLQNKNFWQSLNPFYWMDKTGQIVIQAGVFIGHLISVGLTSDGLQGVPPEVSTAAGTLMEGLTDWHFLFEFGHDDHHHHEEEEQAHGHHHSNLPGTFASVLLLPLLPFMKLWDWAFGDGSIAAPITHDEHQHCHGHTHAKTIPLRTSTAEAFRNLYKDENQDNYDDMPDLLPMIPPAPLSPAQDKNWSATLFSATQQANNNNTNPPSSRASSLSHAAP
jgi:hypothetical protein